MIKQTRNLKYMALTLGTCAAALLAPVQTVHAEAFSTEQVQEIEGLFKKFLAENPELILKSVDDYRAEQEAKSQLSAQENLSAHMAYFSDKNLPAAGNVDGDVTIVEFFDYNCGYCRKAFEDIMKLIEVDTKVRVVFMELPILSPSSRTMAQLALGAHMQGKYFEMHAALMDYRGSQSEDEYYKIASGIGLDIEKLRADATSKQVTDMLDKASEVARDLSIRGTPGFVIGEKIYPGYIGMEGFKSAIEEARAEPAGQ